VLIDSNLIIYSVQPLYASLRYWIIHHASHYSVISRVEVLGYPRLSQESSEALEKVLQHLNLLLISTITTEIAIKLRQQRKMSLGDAFIAATSLEHNLPLATRNIKDFDWIEGLTWYNPFIERT
jgi:hypothetical protein